MGDPVETRAPAVLEVLRGRPTAEVAARWQVDAEQLAAWVRTFVEAGTAHVTDQPAADATDERDRFHAAFAHEVRTPLSMAQGWVAMLADGEVPADQARDSLRRLHDALERLAERSFDVELMAEAQRGRLALAPQLVPVSTLAADLDDLGDPGAIGGLGGGVEVVVDPALLRRVLRDLWHAAAASPRPRARRLEVRRAGPWLELAVVREGAVDAATFRALSEPFDVTADGTGVAIGLNLARTLAAAHGGAVGADERGDGAVFWVRVPAGGS
jgi:signal transduction histidine kinase